MSAPLSERELEMLGNDELLELLEREIGLGDRADFHGRVNQFMGEIRRRLERLDRYDNADIPGSDR